MPKYHCSPCLGLMHLRVSFPVLVLRGTRRIDDRRIHDGAVLHRDAAGRQMAVDHLQDTPAQIVLFKKVTELADRGLIRRCLSSQVNAHKAAHRIHVVKRFLNRRIRQVEPQLQTINPQHPLQRNRRPATLFAQLRVIRSNQADQLVPRHHALHVREELCSARDLLVLLKPRQRSLVHRSPMSMNRLSPIPGGKSDLP